jgi:hypothetical protein
MITRTLYEPVTVAFVIITVLILAVSGELFTVFRTQQELDCHRANAQLLSEQRQGPVQGCEQGR